MILFSSDLLLTSYERPIPRSRRTNHDLVFWQSECRGPPYLTINNILGPVGIRQIFAENVGLLEGVDSFIPNSDGVRIVHEDTE